jgi:acetolactate synthase-1/2/3 large subunit
MSPTSPESSAAIRRCSTSSERKKTCRKWSGRALQLAKSDPPGLFYTIASREVLEEEALVVKADLEDWAPVAPSGMTEGSLEALTKALLGASRPLIITSYLGRTRRPSESLSG